ncbi:MAG: quinolinate synthase NadA, partial [Spartobacteria bacterium]|nr:quinolinate synthase NadA [Spartobacteria bacterium]
MTTGTVYERLKEKLGHMLSDEMIRRKAEIAEEINTLKAQRNAVILVHNYMEPAMFFGIADFAGDSLELSRKAAETDQEVIVFCGVQFMAETAKILSPDKTVLAPALDAGCSLAEGITAEDVRNLKKQYPGLPVVTYINTYADVKAETDICCTSGNAVGVINSLDSDAVIFLPDQYLAANIAKLVNKKIIYPTRDKSAVFTGQEVIGWEGYCEVHRRFTVEDIRHAREQYPDIFVLAHPECPPAIIDQVDFAGGTTAMMKKVAASSAKYVLVLTECCMIDILRAEHPDKVFISWAHLRCPYMNKVTMENTRDALKKMQHVVEVPADIAERARGSV